MTSIEFDHLFICTNLGAPEADRLIELGLSEGSSRTHPGQGTANRCFFFHNAMIELLWVHSSEEAQSEIIRPTHLWERWVQRDKGACPFGFGFRPSAKTAIDLPFPAWNYRPPYLPASISFSVGTNANIDTEPLLFYLPFGQRPDASANKLSSLNHPIGWREMTRIEMLSPHLADASPALQAVMDTHLIQIRSGTDYLLAVGFDGESQGQTVDLRPVLPLIFYW